MSPDGYYLVGLCLGASVVACVLLAAFTRAASRLCAAFNGLARRCCVIEKQQREIIRLCGGDDTQVRAPTSPVAPSRPLTEEEIKEHCRRAGVPF